MGFKSTKEMILGINTNDLKDRIQEESRKTTDQWFGFTLAVSNVFASAATMVTQVTTVTETILTNSEVKNAFYQATHEVAMAIAKGTENVLKTAVTQHDIEKACVEFETKFPEAQENFRQNCIYLKKAFEGEVEPEAERDPNDLSKH